MLCEVCGKNTATTYIKTVINGKVTEKHLCAQCAAKEGTGGFFTNPLSDMLTSIFGDEAPVGIGTQQKRCACCGSDFSDIVSTGKLGCSECYETFFDDLLPYFKRIHGSVRHIGKALPEKAEESDKENVKQEKKEKKTAAETLESLKEKLSELIKAENFEEAAVIRDKIKKLTGGKR